MGASVFIIFALVCVILTIFLKIYMPETRNKDTAEVAAKVANGFDSRPLLLEIPHVNENGLF